MSDEIWQKIIRIHSHTKALILQAEEIDPERAFFLPPMIQQRDALDHIVRARAAQLRIIQREDSEEYIEANLDKALGHQYRAFFDVADWLGIILREQIEDILTELPTEIINQVMPKFYDKTYPRLKTIDLAIARVRGVKDIGNDLSIIPDVEDYYKLINELVDMWLQMAKAAPTLREKNEERLKQPCIETGKGNLLSRNAVFLRSLIAGLIGAIAGAALTALILSLV